MTRKNESTRIKEGKPPVGETNSGVQIVNRRDAIIYLSSIGVEVAYVWEKDGREYMAWMDNAGVSKRMTQ